ncbi:MAG: amidohydrolase [Ruminococcaceae bacterium]|nr:amidohydrolase [Oscillospiraceae bacterium]
MKEIPVIDFHTHPYLSQEEFYCFYPDQFNPSPTQCMEDIKKSGISHICGSVILKKKYEGGFDYIRSCNDRAYELKKIMGGFYTPGFHIHPGFVKESLEEIELRHKQGFGLIGELVPYMHGWSDYSRKDLGELLEAAEHYHMAVSFHTIEQEPGEISKMIENHPNVTFIAAHPGDKEQYLLHLERIKKYDNIYLDLSGTGIFRYGLIAHGVKTVGSERLIFGTDYPICNPRMYVQAVYQEPISEEDMENIFYRNAQRIIDGFRTDVDS